MMRLVFPHFYSLCSLELEAVVLTTRQANDLARELSASKIKFFHLLFLYILLFKTADGFWQFLRDVCVVLRVRPAAPYCCFPEQFSPDKFCKRALENTATVLR